MDRIEERYYHSDSPFTVIVHHDWPAHEDVKFPSFDLDDEHAWSQTLFPGDTVTTNPENVTYEEVQG